MLERAVQGPRLAFWNVSDKMRIFTQKSIMAGIHQFKIKGIGGDEIDFASFAGKKILVVNVASACGYTPQYKQLEELYETFQDSLVVVGFPCNDFGNQESGTNEEIRSFCTLNFGVKFPLTTKISIVNTPVHPIYQWLTHKVENGVRDSTVKWNFHKYLLDEDGNLVASHPSATSPLDDVILDWVQA